MNGVTIIGPCMMMKIPEEVYNRTEPEGGSVAFFKMVLTIIYVDGVMERG